MLYVKNLVFLDGAIAMLAPDLDLLGEIASLSTHLAMTHGEQFAAELGVSAEGVRGRPRRPSRPASASSTTRVDTVTYRELQKRRDLIRRRLEHRR